MARVVNYKPKVCAREGCEVSFTPNSGQQLYCPDHLRHKPSAGLRRASAIERPADYYRPKACGEPGCTTIFVPTTGSQKRCPAHRKGAWARANPEAARANARKQTRRYRHKLAWGDPDIYDRCVDRYGEKCGICGAVPDDGWHLAVDHDHETGDIRGLLCPTHNTGLGYFADNPAWLRAAARYLDRAARAEPIGRIPTTT